jgi:DNA-binding MarR family transcriptional regulator
LRTFLDCITLADASRLDVWQQADLTLTQIGALRQLRTSDCSPSDLAFALAMSPASVSRVLDRLERRGLVERQRRGDDRRRIEVRLQPEGRRLLDELSILADTPIDHAIRAFTPSERAALESSLRRLLSLARRSSSSVADRPDDG